MCVLPTPYAPPQALCQPYWAPGADEADCACLARRPGARCCAGQAAVCACRAPKKKLTKEEKEAQRLKEIEEAQRLEEGALRLWLR